MRETAAEDWTQLASGTQGLTGAADTIISISRARAAVDAVLRVTGRDVEDAEHALRFIGGSWTLLDGPATVRADYERAPEYERLLADTLRALRETREADDLEARALAVAQAQDALAGPFSSADNCLGICTETDPVEDGRADWQLTVRTPSARWRAKRATRGAMRPNPRRRYPCPTPAEKPSHPRRGGP